MQQGVLIVDLAGTELTEEDRKFLQNPGIAGVLLFSRNYENRQQLNQLIQDIRQVNADLMIMVDHEGGRVQRFRQDFVRLPAMAQLGRYYQHDPGRALKLTRDAGWLMASELLAAGVELSLAPVLDLDLGKTGIVGDRSFGSDPETVIALSRAWTEGMREAGMACVIKHFPGHGSVDSDSHLTLPVDDRPLDSIRDRDMQPFSALAADGAEGVMPAHIIFSQVDDQPASFSSRWLKGILRQELAYQGVVISDCLTMEGAASAGDYLARGRQALAAGCNLLIVSNREGAESILANLDSLEQTVTDISGLKSSDFPDYAELITSERYLSCRDRLDHLMERYG